MNALRGEEGWQLSVMRATGREAEARHLLAMYNRVQTAFGFPPSDMPEPASVGLPDLITWPADLALTEVHGDPLLKRRAA